MIELKTATYKKVEFLFEDMTTTGGNRLIKFNFPGSDKQAIERQGKTPRAFNFKIIIPHENYFQKRDEVLRILEDGKEDTLTHPTFGDVEKVINGPYTLTEKITELGRGEITVSFEVNDSPGIPIQSGDLPAQVEEQNENVVTEISTDLEESYEVSRNFSDNFTDAIDNLNELSAAISNAANFADPIFSKISAFQSSVSAFTSSISKLIQAPQNLASSIRGMLEDLNNLFDLPGDILGAFNSLFGFGDDDPEIQSNTAGRVERRQNRDLIRSDVRIQSLGFSYLAASQIEYQTTEELDLVQETLEAQYQQARKGRLLIRGVKAEVDKQTVDQVAKENRELISNESFEALDRLRVQAQKTLDEVRVNTRSIITIETPLKPLTILVFEYYGSTELTETIAELNNIKQNAFVEGDVRILTA